MHAKVLTHPAIFALAATLTVGSAAGAADENTLDCHIPSKGVPTLKATISTEAVVQSAPRQAPRQAAASAPVPALAPARMISAPTTINSGRLRPYFRAPRVTARAIVIAADSGKASAGQIAAMASMLNRYKHMRDSGQGQTARMMFTAAKPAAAAASLPKWGDKDCLCHEALRLYRQHKYLEAAASYHRAGDNMLKAWGHPNADIANAVRGEAVCYGAAGRAAEARALFLQAARTYIQWGNTGSNQLLQGTILDLGDTCKELGQAKAASNLQAALPRICQLSTGNPAQALAELDRAAGGR